MKNFVPVKDEKEQITIILETTLIERLGKIATSIGISRNRLVSQCIKFALDNMSDDNEIIDTNSIKKSKKCKKDIVC